MSVLVLAASRALAAYRYVLSIPASSFHHSWAISRCSLIGILLRIFPHAMYSKIAAFEGTSIWIDKQLGKQLSEHPSSMMSLASLSAATARPRFAQP